MKVGCSTGGFDLESVCHCLILACEMICLGYTKKKNCNIFFNESNDHKCHD